MSKGANSSHFVKFVQKGLIELPPALRYVSDNLMYECIMGSEAYGCRDRNSSDRDIVGFTIPRKEMVFPHLTGYIPGFGRKPESFEQLQLHHVEYKEHGLTYDFVIYGIVKYFHLTMQNNPNMLDSLFAPRRCVTKSSSVFEHLRSNRRLFLSKRSYHTFRGYACAQLAKIKKKTAKRNPKRAESIEKYGYDVKYGYHLIRLMLECEQILSSGHLVLDRDSKVYNSIRAGEWSLDRLMGWFEAKEQAMEELVTKSMVRNSVSEKAIGRVLMECLEIHFGSLRKVIVLPEMGNQILNDLETLISRYRR